MRKKIVPLIGVALLLGVIVTAQFAAEFLRGIIQKEKATGAAAGKAQTTIVIDAGHGGTDGGKVGVNGAQEKDINLVIAQYLEELLSEKGFRIVMTREDGEGLADSKVGDLKKRVEIINDTKPLLAVSIHQNSYHEESVHGGQVFYYATSKEGEKVAQIMQKALALADTGNKKQPKANSTYYLLRKTDVPVIIVECGFLSNYAEAEKLVTEDYQRKMAAAVAEGVLAYAGNESKALEQ